MDDFSLRKTRGPLTEAEIRRLYPIRVTGSCDADRWAALFAAEPQMRVVLMVMPRAPEARAANGSLLMAKFHAAAQDFVALTGAHLFVADPDGVWPASAFVDQAHLSEAGAARFRAELAAFVAELP
jgi:lysophospholipase L1-like esterase